MGPSSICSRILFLPNKGTGCDSRRLHGHPDANLENKTAVIFLALWYSDDMELLATAEKIKIGWFSFSCCEDNTIVMTELMNDHWQEWKKKFEFRHARVLQSKNVMDEFDIAFIEGAIASPAQEEKLKDIRKRSKKLVAVGACAVTGLPSGQRNSFTDAQKEAIDFLVARFGAVPKVLKVADVVGVDSEVPGCPMDPGNFLRVLEGLVAELESKIIP